MGAAGVALPSAATCEGLGVLEQLFPPTPREPQAGTSTPRAILGGGCFKGQALKQNLSGNCYYMYFRLLQCPPPVCTARAALEFDWQKVSGSRSGHA